MSSSPEPKLSDGDASPVSESQSQIEPNDHASESDLSDVNDHTAHPAAATPSPEHHESFEDAEPEHDVENGAGSSPSAGNASDDADFDMDDSPAASPSEARREDRSSSNDSRRSRKRKEEEYIRENPELYGLRRSVRCSLAVEGLLY
ncbi:hypothetical protein F4780DRAFT_361478 [Xylariomycetidae sp. FL0641]|nr:hypothetical protein F4780DRAFT_361478 [Xylariomycetidae sp. FL0641]